MIPALIVVDASAVGTFLIPDEAGPFADFAKEICSCQRLHAPSHLPIELASLIRKAQRYGRVNDDEAQAAAAVSDTLSPSVTDEGLPTVAELVKTSETLGLTAYDAAYFLLANRLRAPLLTDDKKLRRIAGEQGVAILMP